MLLYRSQIDQSRRRDQKSAQQPQEGFVARRALLELLRLVQVPQGTREVAGDADHRRQVAERCGLVILLGAGAVLGLDLPEQLERLIEPALHRQHSSEAAPRSEEIGRASCREREESGAVAG